MEIGNFGFGSSGSGGGGGTIGGGGTLNYVAKFTPNGATISNSLLYDNGTSVGVGTTTPDASAILDLTSTSQGFMTPRMTTLDKNAIVSPATSLLLFDTTQNLFSYWDGAAWVNLNNGGIFGANNGLSISGSDVQLGGSLIQPTTISSSGVNTFSVTDDIGTMIRTRDSNGNFIINAVGGNPTFTNSNYIYAFTSDGGTSFTDSTIVYNFGGANSFTQTVDTFSFGDYHTFNGVSQSYNFGRNNTASNSTNIHLFGDFNILNSCSSVSVFGDNNTINSENAKFFIGNNNNNLVVNGSNGYVGIGTLSPNAMLDIIASGSGTIGINLNTSSTQDAKLYFRTNNAASARSQIYLENSTQTLNFYTVNNDTIFWNGNGLAQVKTLTLFTDTTAKFENNIGIAVSPNTSSRVIISGIDNTSAHYGLKIDDSVGNPLLYVRNDGLVGVGASNTNLFETFNIYKFNTAVSSSLAYNTTNRAVTFLTPNASASYGISSIYDDKLVFGRFNVSGTANGFGFVCGVNGDFTLNADYYTGTPAVDFIYKATSRNIGIRTYTPTAALHLTGQDSTLANYAFKVDNSASSPLFYARNDGYITTMAYNDTVSFLIGNKFSGDNTLKVQSDSSGRGFVVTENSNIVSGNGIQVIVTNSGAKIIRSLSNVSGATVSHLGIESTGTSIGSPYFLSSAMLHIQGIDSTSSNYALKVDNSASSPLLYVRNDGYASFNTTISSARLQVNTSASSEASIGLGGADFYGAASATTGLAILLGVNSGDNKQLWIADQDKLTKNSTNPVLQIGLFGTSPTSINAISTSGLVNLDLVIQANGGNLGIGTGASTPLAKTHIIGIDSATKANLRLEPVTNVTEDTTGNTVNTINNTTVALETIAIPTNTVVMIESYVTCRKTGGAGAGTTGDGNGYIRTVKAKNVGGVVTIGVVQSSFTSEDIAPLNATFAVSGTNVVLNVTGANNDNITWNSITKKYKVA